VHSGFNYLGDAIGGKTTKSNTSYKLKGPTLKNSSYVFGMASNDQTLDSVVLITISKISTGYQLYDLLNWMQNQLEPNALEIQGENYQCRIQSFSNVFNQSETRLIHAHGYKAAPCYLVKGLCKQLTIENQPKLFVYYLEDISRRWGHRYACEDWKNLSAYTIDQKQYLKEFISRSERFIEILE
jgi:hypothetical protein